MRSICLSTQLIGGYGCLLYGLIMLPLLSLFTDQVMLPNPVCDTVVKRCNDPTTADNPVTIGV